MNKLKAKDGDAIDVFIGDDLDSMNVFIVDQVDPETRKYDECKVMIGFKTFKDAREGYLANYEEGWEGIGNITRMSIDDFKNWLKNGDTTKKVADVLKSWFKTLFKGGMQQDLFGQRNSGSTIGTTTSPSSRKANRMLGVNWGRFDTERPGHKYIRRYRDKNEKWIYVYKNPEGHEFEGDEEGNPIPRHYDWKEGDKVNVNGTTAKIKSIGDKTLVLEDEDGKSFTAKIDDVETHDEQQTRLRKETDQSKWKNIIDKLEKEPKSLKEKVEGRLNEKQEGKQYRDAGERVGGSKKEIAAIRILSAGDLDKLDNATAYRVVTKERILSDIDAEAEKANGVESGAAYLKKKLREAVNSRPPNTPEDRKKFVELTPKIFEKIDAAKTVEELQNISRNMFEAFLDWGTRKRAILYKDDKSGDVSRLLGKEFLNLIGRNSDSAKEHWVNAILMNSFDKETSDKEYKQHVESRKNTIEINKKRMDEYTPEQWENYFKSDPVTSMVFTRKQLADEKKNNPEKYQQAIEDYKKREYKSNEQRNEALTYEKWLEKRPQYKPREADWTWADEKDKKAIDKRKAELKIHDNPPLAFIKRTNGREVKDSDITVDAIKNKYGFKSVQFGHYVKDVEAKEHVRHFIESMNDLEDAIGIDIKKMNQLSGLSIAFGARGSAGSLAHYEPMAKIINLTKTNGDGTIAHEIFHNFDHLLGGMKEGTTKEKVYLSQQGKENQSKTSQAMQEVLEVIKKGDNSVKVEFKPNEHQYTYKSIQQNCENKGYEFAKQELLRYAKDPNNLGGAEDYFKYLATLSKKPIEISFPSGNSKYYDGAKSFKSTYWQSDVELFARAAETYVQDKLAGNDMYNNYLVAGNSIQQPDKKYDSTTLQLTYPQGEERVKINEAFDKLIQAAKEELNIGIAKKKEGKRISSEIQMQKSLYNPNMFKIDFHLLSNFIDS